MSKRICRLLTFFLVFSIIIFMTMSVYAQYPDHKVDVVITFKAGGGTDVMARTVFPFVAEKLGVPFIIRNKPGAGAQIGYTYIAMAKPDGYTIGNATTSIVTIELTREDVAFKFKENFQTIAQVQNDPSMIFVLQDSPFKTLDDLINYAKENPGEISFSGTSLFSTHHIHMQMLEKAAGIDLNHVAFDGSAETKVAILGGHIDVIGGGFSEFVQLVEDGELRALVTASENRLKKLPDVPTYYDLGYDIEIGSSRGFVAPKGTPMDRVELLANTIKEVMETPEFIEQAKKVGIYDTLAYKGIKSHEEYLTNLQDTIKKMLQEEALVK